MTQVIFNIYSFKINLKVFIKIEKKIHHSFKLILETYPFYTHVTKSVIRKK